MPSENLDALVDETKALIKEVEGGNPEHAAWVAIQDRVKRLVADRTHREVGALLGKANSWVTDVVNFDRDRDQTPFSVLAKPTSAASSARAAAKRIIREDPTVIAEVVKAAPPKARKEALKALAEDKTLYTEVQDASLGAYGEKSKEARKEAKAARKGEDDTPMFRLVYSHLTKADRSIRDAIQQARWADWGAADVERLRARIEKSRQLWDLLLLAVDGAEDVDWDEELARLLAETQELEV